MKLTPSESITKYTALKIALIYATFSVLWILFSDQLLAASVKNIEVLTRIQMVKGWFFVLATGFLIYFLLQREIIKYNRTDEALRQSQEHLQAILDVSPMAISWADREGNIQYSNNKFQELFGYTTEAIPTMEHWHQLVYPDPEYRKKMTSKWTAVLESAQKPGSEIPPIEVSVVCKNGSSRYVSLSGAVLPDKILAVFNDITESRKAEQDRILLSTAIEQADETVLITDHKGVIQYVNPTFERIAGYSREEVIGQNFWLLKSSKQNPSFYENLWNTISSGQTWKGNFVNKRKDGRHYEELSSISPIKNTAGKITNYVAVNRDVTHEKRLESQLQQSQKMEAIGTLAGGIAHDFNNILFPIFGYVEMLQEDLPKESPYQTSLREVLVAAKRASELVKQILTFSRQSEQEIKPLKVQHVLSEVLRLIRSSLPTTIEIIQNIDKRCGMTLADPTKIHQIVMNLVTNAYHAMQETGGKLEISLTETTLSPEDLKASQLLPGKYLSLSVSDTGIGMAPPVIDRIFDPYFSTKDSTKGTGLGLSVVHGIVKGYDGDIRVSSKPGVGSKFTIYLPLINGKSNSAETIVSETLRMGSERILLVDDEEQIVRMHKKMLERLGYHVTAHTSSVSALSDFKLSPNAFDMTITDLTMPDMNGLQLSSEMMAIRPDIPIILCTGFSELINEKKAKELGIRGYVLKPVIKSELSKKICEALEKRQE